MPSISDAELWETRDPGHAISTLYERHARAVYIHCVRRSADWDRAEDLTSAVFIQVVRKPERVRFYDGSALPWLLATANNLDHNARRSLRRSLRREARAAEPAQEPDFAADSDHRVDRLMRLREARDLVLQLPPEEQDVFVMCGWSELSYEQAAFALDIPIGTVRSRLSRARRRLEELSSIPDKPRRASDAGGS